MSEKEDFDNMVHASKKKCQELLLLICEKRPHHMFVACVDDSGQVMVAKQGGNQGIEALMTLAILTTAITQTQRNLGLIDGKDEE